METFKIYFWIIFALAVIGSAIQVFFPQLLGGKLDEFLTNEATLLMIILIVTITTMFALKGLCMNTSSCAREGFENEGNPVINQWKDIVTKNKLDELCSLQSEIYKKVYTLEKGVKADPEHGIDGDEKPEAIARMNTEKTFTDLMPGGNFDCGLLQRVSAAADIDSFFVESANLPENYLNRAFELAAACARLCERLLKKVDSAIEKPSIPDVKFDGFTNPNQKVCSPELIEERRKFIREKKLSEDEQACLLPEEVPLETKDDIVKKRLETLATQWEAYQPKLPFDFREAEKPYKKMPIADMVTYAMAIKAKLDKIQKSADSGEIVNDLKAGEK
jgi:hypothetical protein